MKRIIIAILTAATLFTATPAIAQASKAPNVRCRQLDSAERTLRRKGFRIVEHGGGIFGIVVKSAWVVVNQRTKGRTVHLTAGRSC